MREEKYKAFYYNHKHELLGTDVITCVNGAGIDMARMFASHIADTHYSDCTDIEVCMLAEKKPQCWRH